MSQKKHTARQNDQQVAELSARLASQNEWSAAGLWLEESAQRWEPALNEDYERLFPEEKAQEELFLEIARVARVSGIESLNLVPEAEERRDEAFTAERELGTAPRVWRVCPGPARAWLDSS